MLLNDELMIVYMALSSRQMLPQYSLSADLTTCPTQK